jgi:energy-coupling factor transporter ATP-binding protein EcfA2
MANRSREITYFARTNVRHPHRLFGIRETDRLSHMYVIGKTGTGKSTLLETMILQDLAGGRGFALVDPHGDLADRVHVAAAASRDDVLYIDVANPDQPFGYNPLRHVRRDRRPLAASGMLEVMKKMWPDAWGARMEHILRYALLALLDCPAARLSDILALLTDKAFRQEVIGHSANDQVRQFWAEEYRGYSPRYRQDSIAPIQNKVGAFLADPRLKRFLTDPEKELRFREVMDSGKAIVINLAKGRLGEDSSNLLGGLLVTTLGLAAFSRADTPENMRCPFIIYVDEFQNFTTLAVANMLAELRKYQVGAVLAHQYLDQVEPDVRHAVLGNAGTLVSFRVGGKDAPHLEREFAPVFDAVDLVALPNHEIYLRLMIEGAPSRPFSATTVQPGEL